MWRIDDLIEMSVEGSAMQQAGRAAGIPGGVMKHLRSDLRQFKRIWHEQYRHGMVAYRVRERQEGEDSLNDEDIAE